MSLSPPKIVVAGALAAFAAALAWRLLAGGAAHPRAGVEASSAAAPATPLTQTTGIALDGDFDDPGWKKGVRTGAFEDDLGAPMRPYTDARIAWGDGVLYFGIYSADQDIVTREDRPDAPLWLADDVHVAITVGDREYGIDASPAGTITDGVRTKGGPADYTWKSGAHVATEMDGTLNKAGDNDEEWLVELAVPLASLGLEGKPGETFSVRMRRCDTAADGRKSCGGYGDSLFELR